mgnify:CR=1 FL=1
MERTPVSSSNLASLGYDPNERILEIEFNDGSVYRYYAVPKSVYEGLMNASSHGKYFHSNVKGDFEYEEI